MSSDTGSPPAKTAEKPHEYVVVARRYRPQSFEDLIGQEHVAKGLCGAIAADRVGHAYLFTGARGVGKTSAARILAKALNCVQGPTPSPCNECEVCLSVAAGGDVDVLEIDGASNRGIDEIRQLRQNVAVRPTRVRFKIFIIDEVHMLTREAFNALLKTLEEPPDHVKFVFATTEPHKVPITILSRCQRFDFAGIDADSIEKRLAEIAEREGTQIDAEALALIARRAAGSMRDGQSLLEQLLAAAADHISASDVHELLGTAPAVRLAKVTALVAAGDAKSALEEFDDALNGGVDPGIFLEQWLGFLRDVMATSAGGDKDRFLHALPSQEAEVRQFAQQLGLQTVLATMQIVEQALGRLRTSPDPRTLAELALVRATALPQLEEISNVVTQVLSPTGQGTQPHPGAEALKKNTPPPLGDRAVSAIASSPAPKSADPVGRAPSTVAADDGPPVPPRPMQQPATAAPIVAGAPQDVPNNTTASVTPMGDPNELWRSVVAQLEGIFSDAAEKVCRVSAEQDRLVVWFPATYTWWRDWCDQPEQMQEILAKVEACAGRPLGCQFRLDETMAPPPSEKTQSRREKQKEIGERSFVKHALDLFGDETRRFKHVPGPPHSAAARPKPNNK